MHDADHSPLPPLDDSPFTPLGDAEELFGVPGLPFTPAIRLKPGTELVFASGCLGPPDGEDDDPSIEAEVRRAYRYLARVLALAGGGLEHVVSVTKFLTNLERDNATVARVTKEVFPILPTSTTVEVSRLVPPDLHFEVNAIAAVPVRPETALPDQGG
ncbi:RidA family protein [Amycolatopsis sp. NPDC051903]|uniref:RidA family protein n=1 Tax=Amycolatopsis sp. NPDC051903 TaxID=3363936 RepID=UPI00379F2DB8